MSVRTDSFAAFTNVRGEYHYWFPSPLDIQQPVTVQRSTDDFDCTTPWDRYKDFLAVMNHDRQRGSFHSIPLSAHLERSFHPAGREVSTFRAATLGIE